MKEFKVVVLRVGVGDNPDMNIMSADAVNRYTSDLGAAGWNVHTCVPMGFSDGGVNVFYLFERDVPAPKAAVKA